MSDAGILILIGATFVVAVAAFFVLRAVRRKSAEGERASRPVPPPPPRPHSDTGFRRFPDLKSSKSMPGVADTGTIPMPAPPAAPPAPSPAYAEPVPYPKAPEADTGGFSRDLGTATRFTTVRIYYATDRIAGDFSRAESCYLNDRDPERALKYGTCDVSVPYPDKHKIGRLETPSIWRLEFREDPEKHIVVLNVTPHPRDEFFREIGVHVTTSARAEALVFVHGYNVTFHDAARRTAQLAYDLQFDGAPILYSWPSRAQLTAYPVDETNVAWTVPQLRNFLVDLARLSGARVIHLVAHSMGNRALSGALHELALAGGAGVELPVFRQVILTAPDIDADTFASLAATVKQTAHRVTLYACAADNALAASRQFHGYRRAGDLAVAVPGIDVVDASAVDTSLLGHSYFAGSRSVISDIFSLLRDETPPARRFGMSPVAGPEGTYYVFRP